ncbi:MAG: 50S ribosomal protein L29 [Candidatus Omnitrophica bacterium]|nr:50S ribosomal protein L29 [Candidatus Omnitrophota bacterium]
MNRSARLNELRALPAAELAAKAVQLRQELRDLRIKSAHGSSEQPHRIRDVRRQIARTLTVQRQRTTETTDART